MLTAGEFTSEPSGATMRGMPSKRLKLRGCGDGYYRTSWYDDHGEAHGRSFGRDKWAAAAEFAAFYAAWQADASIRNPTRDERITLRELWGLFEDYAHARYVHADGTPTGEARAIQYAFAPVLELYGAEAATEFGPLRLQAVRAKLVGARLCRNEVNKRTRKVRQVFAWAAAQELIPASVWHGLQAVRALRAGERVQVEPGRMEAARVTARVMPVHQADIKAVVAELPNTLATMVRLQLLCAGRPQDVCQIRAIDIDMTGEVWLYRPAQFKGLHLAMDDACKTRILALGPQAQTLIRPFLTRAALAFLFSPRESMRQRWDACENHRRKASEPASTTRTLGDRYNTQSYGKAIRYAIRTINERRSEADGERAILMPTWGPNRLRHTALTEVRRRFGLEAAQLVAGHARADVTQIYAERNMRQAIEIARAIG